MPEQESEGALSPEQLGDLPLGSKYHVYKNAIIRGSILHCRLNPRADARTSLFNIIVFLTDNGHGICHLSVAKLCQLLHRHRDTILENLGALEKDGPIIIYRKAGMMNRYTIAYPRGLAEIGPNVGMLLDAFLEPAKPRVWTSAEDAIAHASTTNQSGTYDRSGVACGSDVRRQSSLAGDPVGSDPHSISSKYFAKEQQPPVLEPSSASERPAALLNRSRPAPLRTATRWSWQPRSTQRPQLAKHSRPRRSRSAQRAG